MILDAFLYAGESEMLDLRLRTLAPVVDHFVAVVCTRTHQGQIADLPLIDSQWEADYPIRFVMFEPAMERTDKAGRVWQRPPDERGRTFSPWFQHIEKQHRDYCRDAVLTITEDPDAIVMVSDVDEIPDPKIVEQFDTDLGYAIFNACRWWTLEQRFHSTALDYLVPQAWYGTCICRFGDLEPQAMRDARTTVDLLDPDCGVLKMGGHHLSWMGTDKERQHKLDTFSHAELGEEDPAEWKRAGVHAGGLPLQPCEFPGRMDWPAPLLDGSFTIPESWRA